MLRVNDKLEIAWREGMTVRDLLRVCHFTFPLINVTVNGRLVRKDEYDHFELPDGADVRVIHLISGG
jgi:thiamine biosynthesis protein ThiS